MIGRRLLTGFLLICCPAVCATLLSVVGYLKIVPLYEGQDRARVVGEYREVAADLKEDPAKGLGEAPARRGVWRSMKPGRWGFFEDGPTAVVWYSEGGRIQSVSVARVETIPIGALLTALMAFLLVLFWGLTFAGCLSFRNSVKERDDFVAATAHDRTTPLVALRRLIGRDDAEAKAVVERMVRLVKNLTDYLRLFRGNAQNLPIIIFRQTLPALLIFIEALLNYLHRLRSYPAQVIISSCPAHANALLSPSLSACQIH